MQTGKRILARQARWGHSDTFRASELTVQKSDKPVDLPPLEDLAFGKTFSNHMLQVDWTREGGWEAPRIVPYGDLTLSPAASSLHYALQCFEGQKAYRKKSGEVLMFRPDMNAKRLNRSTERLALPTFDNGEFIEVVKKLVEVDKEWIPQEKGYSLYVRPTVISTDVCLGVAPAAAAQLFVITCPVGPYYKEGFKPVSLYADNENVRAWKGGSGDFKLGANYGPTISPAMGVAKKGYSQILWLGPNNTITEVGAMNMFFLFQKDGQKELVTCPLDGTVLPGVTRDSVLKLAAREGVTVSEREYTMDEVVGRLAKGEVCEAFGTGTAAIISMVDKIHFAGQDYDIPVPEDSLSVKMLNTIQDIQYGDVASPFDGWSVKVC
eukprot:TRINITY_DN29678_c0_g1_i1.p2 TRINITY_DN29678_c0_g1~~TRINITY_DN29678_c0_g1_i1.p2  ORF type:complete len:379 (+),score=180.27 TRINITY_DN29678_c0_g1_i1:52-1188(+)